MKAESRSFADVVAVDFHVHVEVGPSGADHLSPELRQAAMRYFKGDLRLPPIDEIAEHYRERKMMAVVFGLDSALTTGQARIPNEFVVEKARQHSDVLIPFASIDPRRGGEAVTEAKDLLAEGSIRGFKFHPNIQQFHPNDRLAYPLYELIQGSGAVALFHTGHSGIGSGLPGGGGIRLKYGNPMAIDDVAVDFPEMSIVMAHPAFPWQDEALSVAMHKPQVAIDLSGWSPKRFPPQLVRAMATNLAGQTLFGSDFPLITPDRWMEDFATLELKDEVRSAILKENALRILRIGDAAG
ncbi:MAG TPA: amidohydrolase family protein [Acidimicrobiia bacterium]|nr:amidohydrolase family protein [Acidimicrobiia bacterium]